MRTDIYEYMNMAPLTQKTNITNTILKNRKEIEIQFLQNIHSEHFQTLAGLNGGTLGCYGIKGQRSKWIHHSLRGITKLVYGFAHGTFEMFQYTAKLNSFTEFEL
jgi:hypothetical protein